MQDQRPLTDSFKTLSPVEAPALPQNLSNRLYSLWDQLTGPKAFVPDSEHRKVRLLCSTLVVLIITSILITLVIPVLSKGLLQPIFLISNVAILGTYFMSRTKHYNLSAILLIVIVDLVVWLSILDFSTADVLEFVAIVAILAGIFLSSRATVVLIAANFAAVVVASILQNHGLVNPTLNFRVAIDFYITFFGLFLILVRYRDLLEKDRVAEALKAEAARRAVDDLRALDQVKSKFLASMSHELRTPLNSILNFTEFVLNGVFGPVNEEQTDALKTVVNSGDFLLGLINDVLDMTKIESGALELFIEQVDLKEIIAASFDTAKGLVGEKPIELVEHISPDLPIISGDKRRIQQILNNLLSNAIKFTMTGSVTLDAICDGDTVRLSVRDSGTGIAPQDQELIFQPFRQTKQGVQQGSGTGLGLPISRSLAEAHGGKLTIDSKLGEGSTFYVILPLKARGTVAA